MKTMNFNRDRMAEFYAKQHIKTDPGTVLVVYLPHGAEEREIRLLEVNSLMGDRNDNAFFPISFCLDREDKESTHTLSILDVTPEQWERIESLKLQLPDGWSLENAKRYTP